ncbi:hypothetical protein ABZZ20_32470 [Streptomyces sp. NPDC006430]|uniref:hypothetical protein n=1 Tax=Streptomyces sp. NPDC006430 TaxID=3154299 RepID=UPI0033BA6778
MYEMHVGTAATGTGLVWHVVAHDRPETLCGLPLQPSHTTDTEQHCLPCITEFQRLIQENVPDGTLRA